MKKIILFIITISAIFCFLKPDASISAELDIFNNLIHISNDTWIFLYSGNAELSLKSKKNKNVKGEISFYLGNNPRLLYSVPLIYITNLQIINTNSYSRITNKEIKNGRSVTKIITNDAGKNIVYTNMVTRTNIAMASVLNMDFMIDKLFFKVRFPFVRLTMGKTRLSWGEGNAFNSGDVLFGSDDINIDLTAASLRDQTGWLTSLYFPLGPFVFLETVVMAPPLTGAMQLKEAALGGRFYATPGKWKTEAGYLYSGQKYRYKKSYLPIGASQKDYFHKPYLSLKYNLEADIYMSTSAVISTSRTGFAYWDDTWQISGGAYYMVNLPSDYSLTLRVEGLFYPKGEWDDTEPFRTIFNIHSGELLQTAVIPGAIGYGEIIFNTGTTGISLGLSSLFSPLDSSFRGSSFVSWNVYQGFNLIANIIFEEGQSKDLFYRTRPGNIIAGIGARYKF